MIAKDAEWRAAIFDGDRARKDRNKVQQEVSKKKKAKEECDDLVKQIQEVRACLQRCDWFLICSSRWARLAEGRA